TDAVHSGQVGGIATARSRLQTLLERLDAPHAAPSFLIAFDIDRYDHQTAQLLDAVVRTRQVRVICTTHRISGAADLLARNPAVQQFPVPPLTPTQAGSLLTNLLRVNTVAPELVHRWHSLTRGSHHALITLALSAERRGVVQRTRNTAWIARRDDMPPTDFIEQLGPLTKAEREVLDLVAYAAPLREPALIRTLDPAAVHALLSRNILTTRNDRSGVGVLDARLPVIAETLRTHLTPLTRMKLADRCF